MVCQPIRIVHRLDSYSVSDFGGFFYQRLFQIFLKESSRFVSVSCCPDVFLWHQENKNTSRKSQTDVSLLKKKNLVSRNELREIDNAARDVNVFISNFQLRLREFLFLICVQRTISMKILVLRVINSSRHRKCFIRGYMHSLFVSKANNSSI